MPLKVPVTNRFYLHWSHGLWLLVLLLTAVLQFGNQVESWRFDRSLIENGHYWLLLSGHFVHLNWTHWGLNMAGLGIVAFFFTAYGNVLWWSFVIAISSVFVGLGLYWLNTNVGTYVGLSGVLHGLFIFGALREARFYPTSGYALLVLLVGKLIWEFLYGALPGSEELTAGHVITDAHLYGAIGGAVASLVLFAPALFNKLVEIKNR
jgi:rhomboid family GlyGly-CTERM serine protease